MSHILGIKFRDHGQVYYFESGPFVVALGDDVLVQTEQGLGMGHVVAVRDELPEDAHEGELKPIFRLPTDEDRDTKRENDQLGREARRGDGRGRRGGGLARPVLVRAQHGARGRS